MAKQLLRKNARYVVLKVQKRKMPDVMYHHAILTDDLMIDIVGVYKKSKKIFKTVEKLENEDKDSKYVIATTFEYK